jgi:glyceraldehyde 3-phosphate dehydrogenase
MVKVLHDAFGVRRGFMTTIHAYTRDQNLVDAKHKDLRRARAAALNIIPTSSGASQAVGDLIPELAGKFDGMAYRVPTPVVSVVDLVADLDQTASEGAINEAFLAASEGPMKGYLYYERDELVSSDFKNHPGSSIFDAPSTMVLDGDMAKTMAWYDNEWGYSCRIADICALIAERGLE